MGPARERWNAAIQERIGFTSTGLSQMKGIKMMGLSALVQDTLQQLRSKELKISTQYRWILTRLATLGKDTCPCQMYMADIRSHRQ